MRSSGYNPAFTAITDVPGDSCCSVCITSCHDGAAHWRYNAFELGFLTCFCSKVECDCATSQSQCSSSALVSWSGWFWPNVLAVTILWWYTFLWVSVGLSVACGWVYETAKQWQGDNNANKPTPNTCKLTVVMIWRCLAATQEESERVSWQLAYEENHSFLN